MQNKHIQQKSQTNLAFLSFHIQNSNIQKCYKAKEKELKWNVFWKLQKRQYVPADQFLDSWYQNKKDHREEKKSFIGFQKALREFFLSKQTHKQIDRYRISPQQIPISIGCTMIRSYPHENKQ